MNARTTARNLARGGLIVIATVAYLVAWALLWYEGALILWLSEVEPGSGDWPLVIASGVIPLAVATALRNQGLWRGLGLFVAIMIGLIAAIPFLVYGAFLAYAFYLGAVE